jgi:hypothetical protein
MYSLEPIKSQYTVYLEAYESKLCTTGKKFNIYKLSIEIFKKPYI